MGIDRMLRLTPCILSASATQRFAFGTRLALSAKNVPRADAPLRNIVALLAWCASHCSLFLHLSAVPVSATGSGAALRPSRVRFPYTKRHTCRKSGKYVFGAGDGNRTHTASLEGWNSNH